MTDRHDIRERLAFLDLGEEDVQVLARLRPVLEKHADNFAAAFYRHLLSFTGTRELLSTPEVKSRMLEVQRDYLLSLVGTPLDKSYFDERIRIGRSHQRAGVEPRWYLSAYALYLRLLTPLVLENYRTEPAVAERSITALLKVLMLDAQLAIEAYIEGRERDLEEANRELAKLGEELEVAYRRQEEELRATSDRAQAAEELASVATIVAGLAHEIGTPMSVIQGHTELLESATTDKKARWRLRTIREQIERISGIIQTLLNMARPHETEHTAVELREVLATSLVFLSEAFRQRGIQIRTDLEPHPELRGDREKLQQLFINLFLNAADAMPEGGELRVGLRGDGDDQITVTVADTGHGMTDETLPRIFDPFFTTKAAGQGSGLGLMVARNVVRDHQGTIEVSSTPGVGTEFRIELPCRGAHSGSGEPER